MNSFIRLNGHFTECFPIQSGVRQGDNLSPTLFGLYVNDLIKNINNLNLGVVYGDAKISILAYADDIALIADSEENLQIMLNTLQEYCCKWRLLINTNKTQIMHFKKPSQPETDFEFQYGGNAIPKTKTYRYLGINMNNSLDIGKMVDTLGNASSRALANIISKFYKIGGLDYMTFYTLYNAVVQPVMNYAAATWGHKTYQKCSTVQNRAMRTILGVGRVTPIAALYGDLNWTPPYVKHKIEVIRYWLRLCKLPENRLTKKVFNHDNELAKTGRKSAGYEVKMILETAGLDIWDNQNADEIHEHTVIDMVHQSEMRIFHDNLKEDIQSMSRLSIYRQIKSNFELEKYVEVFNYPKHRGLLAKGRMGTLPIRVETGRYRGIAREERLCQHCDVQAVEDEVHVLLYCDKYNVIRENFYQTILTNIDIDINILSDTESMKVILANENTKVMFASAKYLQNVLMRRSAS
jgi:hypothetical protein